MKGDKILNHILKGEKMKKLLIILCLGLAATLVMKYLASNKENAAKVATKSLLDAMKEKDVDRTMEYLEYDAVVSELDMWANIGGGNFGPDDVRAQLKKSLEKNRLTTKFLMPKPSMMVRSR